MNCPVLIKTIINFGSNLSAGLITSRRIGIAKISTNWNCCGTITDSGNTKIGYRVFLSTFNTDMNIQIVTGTPGYTGVNNESIR